MSNRFTFKNLNLKVDNLGIQRKRLSLVPSMVLVLSKSLTRPTMKLAL